MTTVIYAALFLVTCAYAALLARFRHLWEPHLTWLEVVIGTALVLLAPYLNARYVTPPPDWATYEADVHLAFLVGGAPIIIWQLTQSIRAWRHVERRIRSRDGHPSDWAATLAAQRRPDADDDD